MPGALAIAATILLTVYGQLIVKWQVGEAGDLPSGTANRADVPASAVRQPLDADGMGGRLRRGRVLGLRSHEVRAQPCLSVHECDDSFSS